MTTYLLRSIPMKLWARVKQRATSERRTLRAVILELLEKYASADERDWN